MTSTITRDLVIAAYQALLDRDPESEEVVAAKVATCRSPRELLGAFVNSAEFKERRRFRLALRCK